MGDELIADKAYAALKALVLSGDYIPGAWIKLSELQHRLQVGMMPIRFACRALAAEGFIELHAHRGLYIRDLHAREIQAKLEVLRDDLLAVLNGTIHHPERVSPVTMPIFPSDRAVAYEILFVAIAGLSGNYFRQTLVRGVAERLRIIRRLEGNLATGSQEFDRLHQALAAADYKELRRHLTAYFRHRIDAIPQIILRIHQLRAETV